MPSRHLVLGIVLFWMLTIAWLFQRDLWPRLRPGEPPPYTIDLVDEARGTTAENLWKVFRGDKQLGRLRTHVQYEEKSDTFELHSEIGKLELVLGSISFLLQDPLKTSKDNAQPGFASMYRVTRQGQLREMAADVKTTAKILSKGIGVSIHVHIDGMVQDRVFTPRGFIEFAGSQQPLALEPVEVSTRGSILNPLHPVNRILGLRRGQHWQMPLVDPLSDSISAMLQKNPIGEYLLPKETRIRVLQTEVLSETKSLEWRGQPVSCLQIKYGGDQVTALTWVRESDGLVLRQEAAIWGEQIRLERE